MRSATGMIISMYSHHKRT